MRGESALSHATSRAVELIGIALMLGGAIAATGGGWGLLPSMAAVAPGLLLLSWTSIRQRGNADDLTGSGTPLLLAVVVGAAFVVIFEDRGWGLASLAFVVLVIYSWLRLKSAARD